MGNNSVRISKIVKEFNIGITTLVEFLKKKGIEVEANPNDKVSEKSYALIAKEFGKEQDIRLAANKIAPKPLKTTVEELQDIVEDEKELFVKTTIVDIETKVENIKGVKVVGKLSDDELQGKKSKIETIPIKEIETKINLTDKENKEPIVPTVVDSKNNIIEPVAINEPIDNWIDPDFAAVIQQITTPKEPEIIVDDKINSIVEPELIKAKDNITELKQPVVLETINLDSKERNQGSKVLKKTLTINKSVEKSIEKIDEVTESVNEPIAIVEPEFIATKVEQLSGPNVVGKIDLKQFEVKKTENNDSRKKRQRIKKDGKVNVANETQPKRDPKKAPLLTINKVNTGQQTASNQNQNNNHSKTANQNTGSAHNANTHVSKPLTKVAPKELKKRDKNKPLKVSANDDDAVQKQIKDTLARLTAPKGKTKSSKYRRDKRDQASLRNVEEQERQLEDSNILQVTEFVTVNELASMIDAPVVRVIEACMNLGLMVSINQRLDAEALVLVAEEFGYKIEFVTADLQDSIIEEIDLPEDLVSRSPIITVMGHVDHGKTSLLDYIRSANVIAGEAGGITQHIGAYSVKMPDGRQITFLDTPGHEAFTAMRARGAKVTDLAIIIIAADDAVMPQTIEAINHAVAAGVPIVFALNKIDKQGANPEKIREQLANMNFLLEDWGGKYQSQEIAAKQGLNVDKLLEKVLLEADMLELKANPNKRALGTVIESSLDKGRGFVTTLLVQSGTLSVGDIVLSGSYTGRVKAMFNERGQKIDQAGPSTPALILGLNGAPTAGETFNVMEGEKEAREIASKREQLIRMQGLRTKKHITLDEIGRRIAIGSFKELNIVVKADMDGSVEALSDSLIQLSTEEIQVNVIHKAVGAVSESDVMLAAASNAIIIGFQVRPSISARKLAEKEEIEIRLYSVIYGAIDEVKDGIEGMLEPEMKEEINATVEVLEVFKITKVGSVAGCIVREGKITRNTQVRLIRDGIVVFTGKLGSLKRFKDDVKEVANGYECGLNIDNYNDIKVGDMVEAFEIVEVKRKL